MTVDIDELKVSDVFDIRRTSWGGRACFSNRDLKAGEIVLKADYVMGTSISYEFRKEVCHYCFLYNRGERMKTKLKMQNLPENNDERFSLNKKNFDGAGLWFCSELCLENYVRIPNILELINCYQLLQSWFKIMTKSKKTKSEAKTEENLNNNTIDEKIIEQAWHDVRVNWIPMVDKTKPTKRSRYLTRISEEEYACCRFIAETIFKLKYLDPNTYAMKSFMGLQSNEIPKISRFPILLPFQITVFKTLKILLPENYRELLTISLFRHILGSEYANSFGIWEDGESYDSRELLGYWMFPQASYFNHTCKPNITKSKSGRAMLFTLNRDVSEGDELNIDYSDVLSLPVVQRRQFLNDNWFFLCQCESCLSDLKLVH